MIPAIAVLIEDNKIFGGYECRKNSASYQASLQSGYHFYGGSLISSTWVVSAVHCYKSYVTDETFFKNIDKGTEQFDSGKVIMHPSYNSCNLDNDVKLSKPTSLNSYMCTVVMPCSCASSGTCWLGKPTQQRLWVASTISFYPDQLFCLDLPILSSGNSTYHGQITYTCSVLASWMEARTLARETVVGNGQLQGAVSWGYSCAQTKICNSWISSTMSSN
uniref:trypsin-3-like n=1 Tax=Oncorhynchus gorbuscha TaxID=8017 RepID=UPI001EAF7962|nr:trypsin-3-like [Oncorhynchus gorbuscha]